MLTLLYCTHIFFFLMRVEKKKKPKDRQFRKLYINKLSFLLAWDDIIRKYDSALVQYCIHNLFKHSISGLENKKKKKKLYYKKIQKPLIFF